MAVAEGYDHTVMESWMALLQDFEDVESVFDTYIDYVIYCRLPVQRVCDMEFAEVANHDSNFEKVTENQMMVLQQAAIFSRETLVGENQADFKTLVYRIDICAMTAKEAPCDQIHDLVSWLLGACFERETYFKKQTVSAGLSSVRSGCTSVIM
ncbi:hypothetical protein P3342_006626 [Pyrenophora teres f. teres]|uniref:Uncharacterized protein n=1 Tax=Pyrenophora teres f. teres (strain 0-1) TaxID=861557 RepID=E3RNK5_PYRTT|nr:hypothetical protein PTT_10155 [Pyrenophora teres f. teres 0-1]KAK1910350.1 hypothetical protein P3342_006626 [Pyrenophora teres f. teres]